MFIAATLGACAHPAGSPGGGSARSPADLHPCATAGACTVNVVIPDDVVRLLDRAGIVFKIYDGCPRTQGFRDITAATSPMITTSLLSVKTNSSMRGANAAMQSSNSTMVVPRLSGRYATIGIFYRTEPGKYAVVDFGDIPDQVVKFGFQYNGRVIVDDNLADSQNRTIERHLCP
jgi:hypothetical protein